MASCTFLERGVDVVFMDEKAVVAGPMTETVVIECAPSLQRSAIGTVALVLSAPLWGQQFSLTGNYGLQVPSVLVTLTLTMTGKKKWEDSSRCVRRRLCSIWGFWGRGMSTPLLMRKMYSK